MADVLAEGLPVTSSKPRASSEKIDYSSIEHAGKPHRGKTTDAEKLMVRQNFSSRNEISYPFGGISEPLTCDDANFSEFVVPFRLLTVINERLARDGMRRIDPSDPEHRERYGLADMAQ